MQYPIASTKNSFPPTLICWLFAPSTLEEMAWAKSLPQRLQKHNQEHLHQSSETTSGSATLRFFACENPAKRTRTRQDIANLAISVNQVDSVIMTNCVIFVDRQAFMDNTLLLCETTWPTNQLRTLARVPISEALEVASNADRGDVPLLEVCQSDGGELIYTDHCAEVITEKQDQAG